jgi:hypothetical protein
MSIGSYEIIGQSYKNTADVPKGNELFYRCEICNSIIPSTTSKSLSCTCRNIIIDVDYLRLVVRDFNKFSVLRKI